MKIGIDARLWGKTGIGRYVKNLIKELEKIDSQNQYIIFVDKEGNTEYHPSQPNFKKWLINYPVYSIEEQSIVLMEFLRSRVDVLHVPHFNVPILYSRPFVTTVHDYTMSSKNFQTTTKSSSTYDFKYKVQMHVLNHAIKKSKEIIVPSNSVKSETLAKYKIPEEKVNVTYEAVEDTFIALAPLDMKTVKINLEKFKLSGSYFLYVGNAYPHKNLETLIVSHKENLSSEKTIAQIVLAGRNDFFYQRTAGFVNGLKLNNKIIFATRFVEKNIISDIDLALLYKGAIAYVHPALAEGFSISPLEAQCFGVPILISDIPVHREIFGDSALYFDPNSTLDLSEKLSTIEKDFELRQSLINKGIENIKKYSWRTLAEQTLAVYNKAAK